LAAAAGDGIVTIGAVIWRRHKGSSPRIMSSPPPSPSRSPGADAANPLVRPGRNGERLRLGLTGLGAIFLIVMVVAAGLKPAGRSSDTGPQGESLAVLGVAPGASSTPAAPEAGAGDTGAARKP
jgi:hypothetical protein